MRIAQWFEQAIFKEIQDYVTRFFCKDAAGLIKNKLTIRIGFCSLCSNLYGG